MIRILLVLFVFLAHFPFCTSLAGPVWAKSFSAQKHGESSVPSYSAKFQEAEYLYNNKLQIEALKAVSQVYEHEVPVQSFYDSLDKFKLEILRSLKDNFIIKKGKETYSVGGLINFFKQVLISRPDELRLFYITSHELPMGRFLYLNIVMGKEVKNSSSTSLIVPASPAIDLEKAVRSLDPWLVSSGLFMARKGKYHIEPQIVVDRWQERPDLWDDVCTRMALLYLAGFSRQTLRELKIENPDIEAWLSELKQINQAGQCPVQTLTFWQTIPDYQTDSYFKPLNCGDGQIKGLAPDKKSDGTTVKQWKGDNSQKYRAFPLAENDIFCEENLTYLKAGKYLISYSTGQAHSRSLPFQVRSGRMIRLVIQVMPNI